MTHFLKKKKKDHKKKGKKMSKHCILLVMSDQVIFTEGENRDISSHISRGVDRP